MSADLLAAFAGPGRQRTLDQHLNGRAFPVLQVDRSKEKNRKMYFRIGK